MKKLFVFIFCFLIVGASFAVEKPTVLVLDQSGQDNLEAQKVINKITEKVLNSSRFGVYQKEQIAAKQREAGFPQIMDSDGYDYQKLSELMDLQVIILCKVDKNVREITKKKSGGNNSGALWMYGFIFPPLFLLANSGEKTYTVNINEYLVSLKMIDAATQKVIAQENFSGSDLSKLDQASERLYLALLRNYQVEGSIISQEKELIYVDLGKRSGIARGDIVDVYRPGLSLSDETITTPEKYGELEVVEALEDSSVCRLVPYRTVGSMRKGDIVKIIPLESLSVVDQARRQPKETTRPLGMGEAFIGEAVGPELLKYNPAGLGQVADSELALGWELKYSSASLSIPNANLGYPGLKNFYGNFVENPLCPNDFSVIVPTERGGLGLNVKVDNTRIKNEFFQYDNGGMKVGLYAGTAIHPKVMVGLGLIYTDQWIGIHNGNSYEFRGSGLAGQIGILARPTENLGLGGKVDLPANINGKLVRSSASLGSQDFSYTDQANLGLGVSYKLFNRLVLNLDLLDYCNASLYDVRLGVEFKCSDNLTFRLGSGNRFARLPNLAADPNYPNGANFRTNTYSAGVGLAVGSLTFDLAGEYEVLREGNFILYPDFAAGSPVRTLLTGYKDARIKFSTGVKF